jgi:hypothetical protein
MTATLPTPRPRLSRRRRFLFALVPLLALLLLGEVLARLNRGPTWFGSYRQLRLDLLARNYPAALDPVLGYVPRAGFASEDNHWGTRVSIDADGLRGNGAPPPPGKRVVVAVGDSFTFGDQVDDDATWPALLEQRLGTPVKNGGVFGYSLTQAVLRGEQLIERFEADVLIVSFIPDDLRRCEFSRRYTAVPWFDLVDGRLVLQPIPPGAVGPRAHGFKDLIAHSALVDVLMTAIDRRWWFENEKQVEVPHLTVADRTHRRPLPRARRAAARRAAGRGGHARGAGGAAPRAVVGRGDARPGEPLRDDDAGRRGGDRRLVRRPHDARGQRVGRGADRGGAAAALTAPAADGGEMGSLNQVQYCKKRPRQKAPTATDSAFDRS